MVQWFHWAWENFPWSGPCRLHTGKLCNLSTLCQQSKETRHPCVSPLSSKHFTCISMASTSSLTMEKKNYWIFHGKTHKQKEGYIYVPLEEVAALITENLDWFQSYSKQQLPLLSKKTQYSTFSWEDLVFFSELHIKTHTQWKHSLLLGHQSRGNLQTKLSQMRPFLCILRLVLWGLLFKTMKKRVRGHHTISIKSSCWWPFSHFLSPLSYFAVMLAFQ